MTANGQRTYIEAIESSCSRYPDLVKLSRFFQHPRWPGLPPGRAAVLEFRGGSVTRFDFQSAEKLNTYFSGIVGDSCDCRLYLLEDLSKQFVEAFGAHFWMDPFLFAAHENSTHWTATKFDYALPRRLPSSDKLDPSFTLRYYEVVKLLGSEMEKESLKTVSNVHRKIELGDLSHSFDHHSQPKTYVVRRNASFWSRDREDGGWDALIVVDPPIGDSALTSSSQRKHWPNVPYGYGYVDFTPWNSDNERLAQQSAICGPPRKSILDDTAWYWMNKASAEQIAEVRKDALISSIFLKKIVASNWNVLLEFVWAKLSDFERELRYVEGTKLNYLAETLADVNLFRRRLSWYHDEVEMSMRSMGITPDSVSDDEDGKEIRSRLQGCKEKVESLTPIVTGMLNVRQADISMRETRLVSKLTLVALVFIPLSFTASIFSMGGGFLPGSSQFWVYFAVAVPITLIILALAWWLQGKSII
ncbi:hypothetical protein ACLMJK_008874 [Lecanora helva]